MRLRHPFTTFLFTLTSLFSLSLHSCRTDAPDISDIKPEFNWVRFDSILEATPNDSIIYRIPGWRNDYAYMLDNPITDSALALTIMQFKSDPLIMEAFKGVNASYSDFGETRNNLEKSFRYLLYYYPDFSIPRIYTYVSGYDLNYPVKYSDTAMAIALDMYLGKSFIPYRSLNIPIYRQRWMEPSILVRDCMEEIYSARFGSFVAGGSLLDIMVEAGKKYCFIEHVMPEIPDSTLLHYTQGQLRWCEENEKNIWALFLEQQLLFSSDREKVGKFIQDAPFTPGFAKESPGRMADFIGWKLLKAYLANNDEVNMQQAISTRNPRAILDGSGYKP